MPLLDRAALRERVERLCAFDRSSASEGERRAAEMIAAELRELGGRVSLEEAASCGGYWWPVGIPVAAATAAGLVGGPPAVAVGALGAAAVADDITGGSQWFRRAVLPDRRTVNVVAEFGDPGAERTVLLIAHHDAAHSGLVFHPELPRTPFRLIPGLLERTHTTPPTMWGAVAGPALVALGALTRLRAIRALGTALSAGYLAAMVDIGLRRVVPGANDNATGVAVLLSLAHWLRDGVPPGLRVMLLSTGAEEAFMEGMQGFAREHFPRLDPARTHVVCLDTVGSPQLGLLEGEGMLAMHDYPPDFLDMVDGCAREEGVELRRGLRFRNATDALIALKAGYPTAMIGSLDHFKLPTNYHWPTDTPENVDFGTVEEAALVCRRVVERLGEQAQRPLM